MASQVPPKKNTAFDLGLTLYKNDGALIANPGTITAKISKDFGDYADVGTVTEEDSTYGQIKLALTATEMNADVVMIYVVDNTSGCVPFTTTIYTAANLLDDIKTDTAAILADTGTDGVVLAADAITAAKIADDAFSNEHFATGAITADAIADNAIDAGAIAADAITAAKIAAGAIDAATFAADVDAEVASYVWDALRSAHTDSGSFGDIDTTADVADAVWDEDITTHTTADSTGEALGDAATGGDPWDTALPGSYAAGTAGKILSDILDDTGTDGVVVGADSLAGMGVVASGTAQSATGTTLVLASAEMFDDDELIGATLVIMGATTGRGQSRTITDYDSASYTATVDTWTTTPTGTITYAIFASAPASATSLPGVNVVSVSADAIDAAAIKADAGTEIGTAVWASATRQLTGTQSFNLTGDVTGNLSGSVGSVGAGGITASSIATGAIDADSLAADAVAEIADGVWDEALSGHTGAGAAGKGLSDVLDDTGTSGVVVASLAANSITASSIATDAIDADAIKADAINEIVDQVWDETLGDHVGSGTTGAGLTAAGSAGDPWSTSVPGAYGAGTAGYLIGTHINAPIGTVDTVVDAIKAKTDYLPSATAGTAGGVFIAGANAATSVSTALTANITGNLSGSVGSVTGAIGSVALKKNTALAKFPFVMRDTVNHAPATGLTVTAVRSIDGAAFGAGSLSAVTELGSGVYTVDFAGADLNGATVLLKCTAAGADDLLLTILTNP